MLLICESVIKKKNSDACETVLLLTPTGMDEVECKVIRTVFNFKLVEENSEHLRRRHAAVDANVGH